MTSPSSDEWKKDDTAVVFNLTTHRSFPVNKGGDAITCGKSWGPTFGGGWSELSALNEPFNADKVCQSWANRDSYSIPVDSERINMLTNQKCNDDDRPDLCAFTISELEVWGITYKE